MPLMFMNLLYCIYVMYSCHKTLLTTKFQDEFGGSYLRELSEEIQGKPKTMLGLQSLQLSNANAAVSMGGVLHPAG